jgi:glycerophosphoryl diester phosphodiesterase
VATSATRDEATLFVVLSLLRLEHVVSPAYESLQLPEYNSGIHVMTPRLIDAARNRNLAVQPWTINTREDLQRMIDLDVDGINTDFPDRLLALLR